MIYQKQVQNMFFQLHQAITYTSIMVIYKKVTFQIFIKCIRSYAFVGKER